jgi:hypothetical protein
MLLTHASHPTLLKPTVCLLLMTRCTSFTTVTPSFIADVHGDYSIQLIVNGSLGTASCAAIVKVSFNNIAPVDNAGLSQSAVVGQVGRPAGRDKVSAVVKELPPGFEFLARVTRLINWYS